MKEIFAELEHWGIGNIIWTYLLTLFFYLIASVIELKFNLFGIIYAYVTCICIGHYLIHNVKPEYNSKFDNSIKDSFVLIPIVGAITFIFWGGSIWTMNYFFGYVTYLINFI